MSPEEKFRCYPQEDPAAVGTFIAFLRLLRGWSQADLAKALGLTASTVSRYETGDVLPDRARLESIARAVGLPLRMLDRTFLTIAAARAAVASNANPLDRNLRLTALIYDLTAALFDLACVAVDTLLADLPSLDIGPWAKVGPAWDLGEDEEDLEL